MMEQEKIDLNKLSQKELLIVTYKKVEDLAKAVDKITEVQGKHEVRISVVETRVMMWSVLFGGVGAAIVQTIISFLK